MALSPLADNHTTIDIAWTATANITGKIAGASANPVASAPVTGYGNAPMLTTSRGKLR
jgi:hypothetical protein